MYTISDSNPNSIDSHTIEAKKGWDTCGRLVLSKKNGEWLIESLFTKSDHRGKGLAEKMVNHVEATYGKVAIQSEADGFWSKIGYVECADSMWRKK